MNADRLSWRRSSLERAPDVGVHEARSISERGLAKQVPRRDPRGRYRCTIRVIRVIRGQPLPLSVRVRGQPLPLSVWVRASVAIPLS